MIEYIKQNYKALLPYAIAIAVAIIGYLYIESKIRRLELSATTEVKQSSGYIANYKEDMGFLSCLAEQHTCIFKNLKNSNYSIIIERCKDENFCAIKYSGSNR